jgi:hypothetical protein
MVPRQYRLRPGSRSADYVRRQHRCVVPHDPTSPTRLTADHDPPRPSPADHDPSRSDGQPVGPSGYGRSAGSNHVEMVANMARRSSQGQRGVAIPGWGVKS